MIRLSLKNIRRYLLEKDLAKPGDLLEFFQFPGGVSCTVILITRNKRKKMVIKQALHKLRVKANWYVPLWRNHMEQDCLDFLAAILPPGGVPRILFRDYENFLFIMTPAPQGAVNWKTDLLKGKVNLEIARKAGRYLATIQNASRRNAKIRKHFHRNDIYVEGRINPYYRVLPAIHPEIKERIASLVRASLNRKMALSLTDYSPKNMMVKGNQLMLIDQEGAHWGDPCFDSAFCLNHLFLKAIRNRDLHRRYFRAIRDYWEAYCKTLDWGDTQEIERGVVRHLGGLLLARVDGKSPVEYLREGNKEVVRSVAKEVILGEHQKLAEIMQIIEREVG